MTVSGLKVVERELRRMPGNAGDVGRLSSGVLAGGVGILMMAAVKSLSSQFNFRSSVRALRLERLLKRMAERQREREKDRQTEKVEDERQRGAL